MRQCASFIKAHIDLSYCRDMMKTLMASKELIPMVSTVVTDTTRSPSQSLYAYYGEAV